MIITAIRIAKLLVKKYRNELTDQDRMELERWYSAHPTNKPFEDTLMSNDVDQKELAWLDSIDSEAAWKKAEKRHPRRKKIIYWGTAAAILAITSFGYLALKERSTLETM